MSQHAWAQVNDWAFALDGDFASGAVTATDPFGHVFVAGVLLGSGDYDPGAGVATLTSNGNPHPSGVEDVFLARYDTNGQFSWAFRLGSMDIEALQGMATDQDGNVFIAGRFGDTLDADPGAGVANLMPFNASLQSQVPDLYLVKYDSAGNYQWHRTIPETDTITTNNIASLATDTAGNVLVAATFGGSVDIDPGAGVVTLNAANGGSFVVAYDASGNYTGWHVQLDATVTGIATDDAGNVAVTGSFQGTADFDPTGSTLNLTSFGSEDVFVARYDQTTAPIYAFRFGSLGQDQGTAIASTADGRVAVTGTFTGTVDFDPGLASTILSALSIPTFDLFVAHYDASGNFDWVRQAYLINGPSIVPTGVAMDADANVLVSGHYNQTLVFPAGGDTVTLTNPNIDPNNPMLVDVFLARYNADGALQWGISPAGPGSNLGLSVATDLAGNAYIAGQFEDSVQFDPVGGANQITYPSVPQLWNGYLAKYRSPFTVQASGDSAVACFGDTSASATATVTNGAVPLTYAWSNGGNTPTINSLGAGTYTITITDENGETAIDSVTVVEPTLLSLVSQQSNVLCNGDATGNVSVMPSGGTMPYAYAWSSGATTPGDSNLTAGTYTVTVTDANSCTETGTLAVIEPSPLTFSILSQSNVLCAGETNGTTTVTAFGGVIPHTYQWSTGSILPYDSNLAAGTHTITITDANGCITTATTVITQPADLMLSVINQFNVPCNGGTNGAAAVTTIGGVLPYNYLWSTGTTIAADGALPAGTHQITVTDGNGCTDTDSVIITEPLALGDSIIGVVDLACFGDSNGSATVVGTGGTMPYNFQWSTGTNAPVDNALPGGPHTVTISDANNCQLVTLVVIDEPDSLWALLSPTPIICAGDTGSIAALVFGGTPGYGYAWSPSGFPPDSIITTQQPGTYALTVTDQLGCTATVDTVLIALSPGAMVSLGGDTAIAPGTGIILQAGSGFTSYTWSDGTLGPSFAAQDSGTYWVTVTDSNGCISADTITVFYWPVSVPEVPVFQDVTIFPNPTNGLLNIRLDHPGSPVMVELFDLQGRVVHTEFWAGGPGRQQRQFQWQGMRNGVYLLALSAGNDRMVYRIVFTQ